MRTSAHDDHGLDLCCAYHCCGEGTSNTSSVEGKKVFGFQRAKLPSRDYDINFMYILVAQFYITSANRLINPIQIADQSKFFCLLCFPLDVQRLGQLAKVPRVPGDDSDADNADDDDGDDGGGDIYIMMQFCLSRKMITSSWESLVTT